MKFRLALLFASTLNLAISQDTIVKSGKFSDLNSVQLELLGPAGIYSLNYERILWNGSGWKTTAQVGFSILGTREWSGINFPISVNQLKSFRNHHIEMGIGTVANLVFHKTVINGYQWESYMHFNGRLGYRYQNPDGHFLFRAGYTPIVYPEFGHWGGLSFGWSF